MTVRRLIKRRILSRVTAIRDIRIPVEDVDRLLKVRPGSACQFIPVLQPLLPSAPAGDGHTFSRPALPRLSGPEFARSP